MSSAVTTCVASPAEQLAALSAALDESERQIRTAVRLVGPPKRRDDPTPPDMPF